MDTFELFLQTEKIDYKKNAPLKEYVYFRIGGEVDYLVMPSSIEEIQKLIHHMKEHDIPYFILGNGSNLLFSDRGYRGVVVYFSKNFKKHSIEGNLLKAQSGALLSYVLKQGIQHSLGGGEFATGIPGSVGGGVVMNAGAYGGELKDIIKEVTVMDKEGNVLTLSNEEMEFEYRNSLVLRKGYIVLEAVFQLKEGNKEEMEKEVARLTKMRNDKQPVELPSAGSTFKRPPGYFAGKLIEDAGLKGLQYGGAMVSTKHCGFVVNVDRATAKDVRTLVRVIQQRIRMEHGVEMETEMKIIGEHGEHY